MFFKNQILVVDDEEDLNYMIQKMKENYEEIKFNINMKKCDYRKTTAERSNT